MGALDLEGVQEPDHIVSHVLERVARGALVSPHSCHTVGTGRSSSSVDRPTSRLSNRTTKKPRAARLGTESSRQAIICVASPITSTSAGSARSPNVS